MKELPYFRFTCQEWDTGDISLESDTVKGLFVTICSYYWSQNCTVLHANVTRKFPRKRATVTKLLNSGIIKRDGDYIKINFLDEQLAELAKKHDKLSEYGKKGVEAKALKKQATLKPPLSNKIDKDKIDKDKIDKNMSIFEKARKQYPGSKRGLRPEWENFIKKFKPIEIVPFLLPAIENQKLWREEAAQVNAFMPSWKNFTTWINGQHWTDERPEIIEAQQIGGFKTAIEKQDEELVKILGSFRSSQKPRELGK